MTDTTKSAITYFRERIIETINSAGEGTLDAMDEMDLGQKTMVMTKFFCRYPLAKKMPIGQRIRDKVK